MSETSKPTKKRRCEAQAVDRGTGLTVFCQLGRGHKHSHYWQEIKGAELLSASWYGPTNGLPVMIGGAESGL